MLKITKLGLHFEIRRNFWCNIYKIYIPILNEIKVKNLTRNIEILSTDSTLLYACYKNR